MSGCEQFSIMAEGNGYGTSGDDRGDVKRDICATIQDFQVVALGGRRR